MSLNLYPVLPSDLQCGDYTVKINGKTVETNTARVSAVPFNRRWPGHQRQLDQSEIIQFVSLSTDEALQFEIIPSIPFEQVQIRPKSLGITPRIENGRILFTLDKPAYFTVEPYGRSRALYVFADPTVDYGIAQGDRDVLFFGAGEHEVGIIELKSNQTLYLDEGAVVYACIRAIDAENIRILGHGILDNSRNKEQIAYEVNAENNDEAINNAIRLHTVQLEYCTNVEIDGITIRDSLVYNIRPIGCKNLSIRNVKIIGCWRYNSDGIDMHNCVKVHVSNCFLRTFDDSICVKGFDCYYDGDVAQAVHKAMYRGGKTYDVFKDVLIENCVIWNDWGKCLEIGAETKAEEISNITFRNCDLIHLTGPVLDCMNVDYADVHDVIFQNINIECDEVIPAPLLQKNDAEVYQNPDESYMPQVIDLSVMYHHEYSRGSENRRGRNRDFLFENIRLLGDKLPRIRCVGYDDTHKTESIRIRGLYLNGQPIEALDREHLEIGAFADDIRIETDSYSELRKNTVASKDQLKGSNCVRFENGGGSGPRILFLGNSILLHGYRPEIGWYGEFGMAASKKELDFVHLLEKAVLQKNPSAAFCLCQVAEWERQYRNGSEVLSRYESARAFDADVIVMRFIENCPQKDFDRDVFKRELHALLSYVSNGKAKRIVLTTGFWRHPGDEVIRAYASENKLPCIELGDLGDRDDMKAIGLFEHKGVANHPGDLGMQAIADRIEKELLKLV